MTEGLLQQLDHMALAIDRSENEIQSLNNELETEKIQTRQKQSQLVDSLVKTVQVKDEALNCLSLLEMFCEDMGLRLPETYQVVAVIDFMFLLYVLTACSYCMFFLYVLTVCSYCMFLLHVLTVCSFCMFLLYVLTACSYCMFLL
jgi:hypothetical protein